MYRQFCNYMIFVGAAVFSAGCGAEKIIDALDKAIDEVAQLRAAVVKESGHWREQLDKMEMNAAQHAKDIINTDLRDYTDKTIASAGIEVRCEVDFVEHKLTKYLDGLKADLEKKRSEYPTRKYPGKKTAQDIVNETIDAHGHIPPHICQVVPNKIKFNYANPYGSPAKFQADEVQGSAVITGFSLERPESSKYSFRMLKASHKDGDIGDNLEAPAGLLTVNSSYQMRLKGEHLATTLTSDCRSLQILCEDKGKDKLVTSVSLDFGPPPPPPPPAETISSVTGNVETRGDNKEGGQAYIILKDGSNVLWRDALGGEGEFNDPSVLPFANSSLSCAVPGNPQLVIELQERLPKWKNIKWKFNISAKFVTSKGRELKFAKNGIVLDAAGHSDSAVVDLIP